MNQSIALISLVVQDYDEAIKFYVGKLGFVRVEDTNVPPQSKRWVVVAPPGARESRLLLAKASNPEQRRCIGAQAGGRVFLFLYRGASDGLVRFPCNVSMSSCDAGNRVEIQLLIV